MHMLRSAKSRGNNPSTLFTVCQSVSKTSSIQSIFRRQWGAQFTQSISQLEMRRSQLSAEMQDQSFLEKRSRLNLRFFAPGKTRNPHSLKHTPGGSSMGSAAAVADSMLPLSIGSQTAGSVIRPAAYCGVVGYKASHGAFSLEGICGLSQNLDSLGFFVRDPRDLLLIREGLLHSATPSEIPIKPNRIGVVRTAHWPSAEAYQQNFLLKTANQLADRFCQISDVEIEPDDGPLTKAQAIIMAFEASRSLSAEFAERRDELSPQIQQLIRDGIKTKFNNYRHAMKIAQEGQQSLRRLFKKYDLLITLSAAGEAPLGLDKTGDPIFNRVWTLLKGPCYQPAPRPRPKSTANRRAAHRST